MVDKPKRVRSQREIERTRERSRGYYAKHPERVKANAAAWRAANPERKKALDAALYQANRGERLAYAADPERRAKKAARMKAWRAANPELSRLKFQAWNYSLPLGRLRELLADGCDACGATEKLHVDHDHACCPDGSSPRSCGRCVRGVLCHSCNTALGLLCEDPARIEALLVHVRRREAAAA